ncbi:hypothetical protein BN13_300018 [Nostocoides jenkinsii Ben 74]|uniref:Uncharacterized protein n=1 Tax=Nostocoides jenkinsii Ben 74 TaxID=1193518 RepID=A0A077ME31_9MICO|nr:hypothetical protein BN13_300018 [Tetrasphaera jenkinsii Ben 74]
MASRWTCPTSWPSDSAPERSTPEPTLAASATTAVIGEALEDRSLVAGPIRIVSIAG